MVLAYCWSSRAIGAGSVPSSLNNGTRSDGEAFELSLNSCRRRATSAKSRASFRAAPQVGGETTYVEMNFKPGAHTDGITLAAH